MAKLSDIRMEELPPRERAVKSGLTFLFVPTIIILGVGLGLWLDITFHILVSCTVIGIIASQILMLVGIREIVLFGHGKEA